MLEQVDIASSRAGEVVAAHGALVASAWRALEGIAGAVGSDAGELLGGDGAPRAGGAPAASELPALMAALGHWRRSMDRALAGQRSAAEGEGGWPEEKGARGKRRRRAKLDGLVALSDGLGASAFAQVVLCSGYCGPAGLGRLGACCAAFGGRLPFSVAGERPWLSLAEAACRRLAATYLRPSLRPQVKALTLAARCGKAFGVKKLTDAVAARTGRLERWRSTLKVGDRRDVMDNDSKRAAPGDRGRWCEAELVGHAPPPTDRSRTRALWKVHFRSWDGKFDEFIFSEHAERFRPAFTMVADWRRHLAAGDEVEVRRPRDFHAPRTFWFQGVVVSRAGDHVNLRLQVIDASLVQSVDQPWTVHVDSERIAMKYEHISPDLWQNLR